MKPEAFGNFAFGAGVQLAPVQDDSTAGSLGVTSSGACFKE